MKIQTKYSIKDRVFKIHNEHVRSWVVCPACEGEGYVELKNGSRKCPECYGRKGEDKFGPTQWHLAGELTIGQVRVYVQNFQKSGMFDNVGAYQVGADSQKVEYMCYETGIGSGTLHNEVSLWPTEKAALAECKRLNALGPEVSDE